MRRFFRIALPMVIALAAVLPGRADLDTLIGGTAHAAKFPYVIGCFRDTTLIRRWTCIEAHKTSAGVHVYFAQEIPGAICCLPTVIEEAVVPGKLVQHQPGLRSGFELDVTLPREGRLYLVGTDDGEPLVNHVVQVNVDNVNKPFSAIAVVADDQERSPGAIGFASVLGTLRGQKVWNSRVAYGGKSNTPATLLWVVSPI
jgi:hypothetical protein